MAEGGLFKLYLKKNLFLITSTLLMMVLVLKIASSDDSLSLDDFSRSMKRIQDSFYIIENNVKEIDSQFLEIKSKMNVVGNFHFKFVAENSPVRDANAPIIHAVF